MKPQPGVTYKVFVLGTDVDKAKATFRKVFGTDPENIFTYNFQVWVGPVPSEQYSVQIAEPDDTGSAG